MKKLTLYAENPEAIIAVIESSAVISTEHGVVFRDKSQANDYAAFHKVELNVRPYQIEVKEAAKVKRDQVDGYTTSGITSGDFIYKLTACEMK